MGRGTSCWAASRSWLEPLLNLASLKSRSLRKAPPDSFCSSSDQGIDGLLYPRATSPIVAAGISRQSSGAYWNMYPASLLECSRSSGLTGELRQRLRIASTPPVAAAARQKSVHRSPGTSPPPTTALKQNAGHVFETLLMAPQLQGAQVAHLLLRLGEGSEFTVVQTRPSRRRGVRGCPAR